MRGGPPGVTKAKVVDEVEGEIINVFHYYVLGLEKSVAEEFLKRPEPLAWGLAALMRPKSGDRAEQRFRCLQSIARGALGEMREQMRITGLLPRVDQALTGAPNAAADVDALRLKGY